MRTTKVFMVTSTVQARGLARLWQSPGTIGNVLSALAHGFAVNGEELVSDIDATIRHDQPFGIDLLELEGLRSWAYITDDPAAFTTWPMKECGCWPHRIGTASIWGGLYCFTEKQGYCNFECECEDRS